MQRAYFLSSIAMICVLYAIFEYCLIPTWVFSADEFVFARHIYEYTIHLPYADFSPYKTVLGYYFLSIPFYFSHGLLQPLFYIKDEIALFNIAAITLSAYWSTRIFDQRAVLFSVCAMMANLFFLTYATDLRVDMLTAWLCLFAALSVLQDRQTLGGSLLGIAFLISQKALWYVLAINAGMIICLLSITTTAYDWRAIGKFNFAFFAAVLIYIIIFSCIANPHVVLYNLFYEAYIQAGIDWYVPIYQACWQIILSRGPVLFLLWPLTFLLLLQKNITPKQNEKNLFIITFAFVAILELIQYKQPFPYNFVLIVPAFFLLYSHFFTWLLQKNQIEISVSLPYLRSILFAYALLMMAITYFFSLPIFYFFSAALPIFFYLFLLNTPSKPVFLFTFVTLVSVLGIVYPLYQSVRSAMHLDGQYQQTMLAITNQLTNKEGGYLSGIPYFYQKDQPIPGMKNLIGPAIDYLEQPAEKLKLLLLPSLYLAPTSISKVINDLEISDVKVILNNYRIMSLPPELQAYLQQHYQHFYGSIYLYAPVISRQQLSFFLKFSGHYKLISKAKTILIDGKKHHAKQIIFLQKGDHLTEAKAAYRLKLVPDLNPAAFNQAYQEDAWLKMIKAILS